MPKLRWLAAAGCVIVIAAVALLLRGGQPASTSMPAPTLSSPTTASRTAAIGKLLVQRGRAVVHHDRRAFAATLDPDSPAFRSSQLQMFDNLTRVQFASWAYTVSFGRGRTLPESAARRYGGVPTYAPTSFSLGYRIAGWDPVATELAQYPTFVERDSKWYLASLTDFAHRGLRSSRDLWDFFKVHEVTDPSVHPRILVLGPADELDLMHQLASEALAAIPRVDAVWGDGWSRRVVIEVPQTQSQLGAISDYTGPLGSIAALTSAEIATSGRSKPVGDRVAINPRNWPTIGSLGRQIVITHELTHVASRADTSIDTPKWLSEGLAEYTSFRDSGVPVTVAAQALRARVDAGHLPTALPTDHDFELSGTDLSVSYDEAWQACQYLVDRYGVHSLVRFYRAVGTSTATAKQALGHAFASVLHTKQRTFVRRWIAALPGLLS